MDEQRKILRVFQLISRLRSPLGCTKQDISDNFEVSERTVERYLNLLRGLGFEIDREGNRFRIEKPEQRSMRHEELIVFSLEEASVIRDAILGCTHNSPVRKSILNKLYALTELDNLSETIYKQSVSHNINTITTGIKTRKQVKLRNYQSVSSQKSGDYVIEPVRFYHYYRYLLAYDVHNRQIKQFKTERITSATLLARPWQHESEHIRTTIDAFGMTGNKKISIRLKLSMRASLLLEEEFPDAIPGIRKEDGDCYWEGEVSSLKGIGRFVMGLIDEIDILHPPALTRYISEKAKKFSTPTPIVESRE